MAADRLLSDSASINLRASSRALLGILIVEALVATPGVGHDWPSLILNRFFCRFWKSKIYETNGSKGVRLEGLGVLVRVKAACVACRSVLSSLAAGLIDSPAPLVRGQEINLRAATNSPTESCHIQHVRLPSASSYSHSCSCSTGDL